MTTIIFYKADGFYYGFEERGHTGYGESGDDVLCAALSAMTMLIVNTVEVAYASDVEYTVNEGATHIMVRARAALPQFEEDERKRYAVSGIMMGYYCQLGDMLEEYGDYLNVSIQDKPWED